MNFDEERIGGQSCNNDRNFGRTVQGNNHFIQEGILGGCSGTSGSPGGFNESKRNVELVCHKVSIVVSRSASFFT